MTLHTIGYAALKYPDLPSELPISLGQQVGVLQRQPAVPTQCRMMAQIGSQYINSLLEYLYSDAPALKDTTSSQYYSSDAFMLLNWLTSNPDVAARVAKHPNLLHDVIEKLLDPEIESKMKACSRNLQATSFEADFGNMLQFVSTILLVPEHLPDPVHPRISELVPKLKAWKRKYSGHYLGRFSDRLIGQIEQPGSGAHPRGSQKEQLVICGYSGCSKQNDLVLCGACKIERYCSTEHQKKDWKFHKTYCNKGLIEEDDTVE
ncbi:hypothetical protein B0O99DRAFT_591116 [Bisporella sp. PMI_857]|nr:hypothetical protein B0O99DRAFT_591116 [Bisporella sp. PMI_857]